MKPGRDLDKLVARIVMRLGVLDIKTDYHYYQRDDHGDYLKKLFPHYSTDISAAWEVIKKLHPGWDIALYTIMGKKWFCDLETKLGDKMVESVGDTPAHAICLAALKTVGHTFE